MSALDDAWQAALAAEHQAVFGYGLLGPKLGGEDEALAVTCSDAHEAQRDATISDLVEAGLTPVAPDADYPTLYPVPSSAAARALAIRLEESCASAWRFLYARAAASTSRQARLLRPSAQATLTASAVRAMRWRLLTDPAHATRPFPGI